MGVSEGEGSTKSPISTCLRSRGFSVRLSTGCGCVGGDVWCVCGGSVSV